MRRSVTGERGQLPIGNEPPLRHTAWLVLAFTGLYLVVAAAAAVIGRNAEFAFYLVFMVVLVVAAATVHLRVNFSDAVLWALSLWGLAHMAGGLLPVPEGWPIQGDIRVLYSLWLVPDHLKYDHLVHAAGFGVMTWVCWQGLRSIVSGHSGPDPLRPTLGMLTLCGAAAVGFGAFNEIVEFAAVMLVPETNVGGYVNTGWDLVSNLVGVVAASVLIWLRGK